MSREHEHVITLRRLSNGAWRASCECGLAIAGHAGLINAWIAVHRRRVFPRFRG